MSIFSDYLFKNPHGKCRADVKGYRLANSMRSPIGWATTIPKKLFQGLSPVFSHDAFAVSEKQLAQIMITGDIMRKRNFIKRFLYYTGIITIPIITLCFIFMAVIVYRKQQDIETEAIKSAQAVRDNYSLVLDSAATQYELLARNPRMSISLRNYISHKQIGYLDVILTNSILSNFASLTNHASYIA